MPGQTEPAAVTMIGRREPPGISVYTFVDRSPGYRDLRQMVFAVPRRPFLRIGQPGMSVMGRVCHVSPATGDTKSRRRTVAISTPWAARHRFLPVVRPLAPPQHRPWVATLQPVAKQLVDGKCTGQGPPQEGGLPWHLSKSLSESVDLVPCSGFCQISDLFDSL